ncbi:hypothetical protein [Kitasatospora viridis]|nr:hypothetical protein [Kitasatospora viridis]
MSEDGSSARTRQLITDWLAEPPEVMDGVPGLAVPPATAADVVAAARRAVLGAADRGQPCPRAPRHLLPLAAAMVVDEHPSVRGWTHTQRVEVVSWVAVLIDRQGEGGVQVLLRLLNANAR